MAGRHWIAAALFLSAALASAPAAAQTPLFSDESELQILIEAPMSDLIRSAPRSTDGFPAALTITDAGEARRFDMELSPRGLSRRTRDICTFPPLRIDLAGGGQRTDTIMQGQNRLKLVTRCRSGASYEQMLVLEYTAYRLYNVVTPMSFRVRPVRTTFRDSAGRRRDETQWNFLIEDVGDLARRNGRREIEVQSGEVQSSQLDPSQAAIVGMFQFMIGNLDWDMVSGPAGEECCHNGKLLAAKTRIRR
jgi:hypothetical protein